MDLPNTTLIILSVVVLLIVLGVAAVIRSRRQRTKRLQEQFGTEYDRTLEKVGDETLAERELEERIAHAKALNIRPLSIDDVNQYALEWQRLQEDFVDEPQLALQRADNLIRDVMKERGFPVEDFDERAALLSVYYPELVKDYRFLHRVAVKEIKSDVNTEDMRQAMVHARALFKNLIKSEIKNEAVHQKESI